MLQESIINVLLGLNGQSKKGKKIFKGVWKKVHQFIDYSFYCIDIVESKKVVS